MRERETPSDFHDDGRGDQLLLDLGPDGTPDGARRGAGSTLPPPERMYRALLERDASFDGLFLVAVRTTGIYCRPTCNARKPKRENVEFFAVPAEAEAAGYRPCRVCRPLEGRDRPPAWLAPLLAEIDADPDRRVTDGELAARGLEPARVRRWFKAHRGATFQAWQRARRIGRAAERIRAGGKVIEAAFESGWGSLSGFAESFRRASGRAPKAGAARERIVTSRVETPFGPMIAGAVDAGICLFEFADRRMLKTQIARLRARLGAEFYPGDHPHLAELARQAGEYFAGRRAAFDLPLVLAGTPFQETVWRELLTIPSGAVRSYAEQARRIGRPEAVRAVARANGDNRIAIVIPCHRVIGSDGKLVGYGGGLWRKRFLLDLEAGMAGTGSPARAGRPAAT